MAVKYVVDPDGKFKKAIEKASKKVSDLTVPFTLMAREWYQSNKSIFDENRQGPGKYKDLSTAPFFPYWLSKGNPLRRLYKGGYKEFKEAKVGFIYPILKSSGLLMDSLTIPTHSQSINQIVNKTSLLLGTKVPYGVYHQSKAPRKKKKNGQDLIPFRPFMFIGVENVAPRRAVIRRDIWIKILQDYVKQVVGGK